MTASTPSQTAVEKKFAEYKRNMLIGSVVAVVAVGILFYIYKRKYCGHIKLIVPNAI